MYYGAVLEAKKEIPDECDSFRFGIGLRPMQLLPDKSTLLRRWKVDQFESRFEWIARLVISEPNGNLTLQACAVRPTV